MSAALRLPSRTAVVLLIDTTSEMASTFRLILLFCLTCGLFIAEAEATTTRWSGCPWFWSRYGSRCFRVYNSNKRMIDAEKACIAVGGNLASIRTYGELSFVRSLIYRTFRYYRATWIGLHDAVQERQFLWTDGSKVRFTCWDRNEPNNLYGREHCTEVYRSGLYWRDRPCYYYRPYICAKDR